jgi:hypothetical protein
MVLATPRLLGFGDGPYGDAALLFGWAALFGLPGWLIVAALTVARWNYIPRGVKVIQNSPAILSGVLYAGMAVLGK